MLSNTKIVRYIVLLLSVSWALAGAFYLLGFKFEGINATIFGFAYMFLPTFAALVFKPKEVSFRNLVYFDTKLNVWYLWAWLIPPAIALLSIGISLVMPGVDYTPDMQGMFDRYAGRMSAEDLAMMKAQIETLPVHPFWIGLFGGMIAGLTINLVAGMGEEMGWRGFLLRAFEGKSFIKTSFVVGFIWGIWHFPLILMGHNYPDHPQIGVLVMTLWCMMLGPLFLYITLKARSVLAAGLMHGTLNGTAGTAIVILNGGNDLMVGVTGAAGFISLAIVLLALIAYDYFSGQKIMWSSVQLHKTQINGNLSVNEADVVVDQE